MTLELKTYRAVLYYDYLEKEFECEVEAESEYEAVEVIKDIYFSDFDSIPEEIAVTSLEVI